MDVEQMARELFAAEIERDGFTHAAEWMRDPTKPLRHIEAEALRAIIAALTPPEGHVVVTRNDAGQAVAVTRQDDEGRILSFIAEFGPTAGWAAAADRELVAVELGVAKIDDSTDVAAAKLRELIDWHVRAAIDPAVNGGYVLVPVEPTKEMLDAGRAAVMAEHCAGPKWTPRQHFEASGRSTAGIPEDVLDERGPLTKESTGAMVFGAMLAARPEVKP